MFATHTVIARAPSHSTATVHRIVAACALLALVFTLCTIVGARPAGAIKRSDIPANALWVANGGSDTNPGTSTAPFATIHKALAIAPAGATVVVRGGTYRESLGPIKRKVTLEAYPGEQASVKGSVVVDPSAFT